MKTTILAVVSAFAAIAFAACGQTASNGNSMTNNAMKMNSNSSMNMNGMNSNSVPMNADHDMSAEHHSEMKSSPNAAAQPYDLQFMDTMTAHHQSAIDMAKMVLAKSTNDELKKFAQKIIDDQMKEIGQMKAWRAKWYADKPPAMNMAMPGMADSVKMMTSGGMKKMEAVSGKEFDSMFLDMMTAHHSAAVTMAKDALTKAERPEIKTLAGQIIKAQDAEIKQMADWKSKWSK